MLARGLAHVIYSRGVRRLDERIPDTLPLTAGAWLQRELERLGLTTRISVIATSDRAKQGSSDRFHPLAKLIQLDQDTYFKRDPVYWAIAAHELGHARTELASPLLARVFVVARFVTHVLVAGGLALMFGNVLYALPHVTEVARALLIAAACLQTPKLADEAIASALAMRSLRASPELEPHHLSASRRALVLAFATYFITAAASTLLLTQWYLVERLTAVPMVPPTAQLTSIGWVAVSALSLALAAFAIMHLLIIVWRRRQPPQASPRGAALAQLVLASFVWLAWDHHASPVYAWCATIAISQIMPLLLVMLLLPMTIIAALTRFTRRLAVDATVQTAELRADRRDGAHHVAAGNARLDEVYRAMTRSFDVHVRVLQLLQLAFVPLLLAFWLV
jgi:Zn-dependent membrane protease YugP